MKSTKYIYAAAFLLTMGFYGCDKIEGGEGSQFDDLSNVNTGQKVLIEEFTGIKCGNCPEGADMIKKLLAKYPDQVVPVSIHLGFFASPLKKTASNPDSFTTDFRTVMGSKMDQYYKIDASGGYPCSFISRVTRDGKMLMSKSSWSTEVVKSITKVPTYDISIENTYDEDSASFETKIGVKFLKSQNIDNVNLVVYLVEDSIMNWQTDYRKSPDHIRYLQRHVFRYSLTGTDLGFLGLPLGSGEIVKSAIITRSFEGKIPNTLTTKQESLKKAYNCYIVAFLVDKVSGAVLQVNEEKITEYQP